MSNMGFYSVKATASATGLAPTTLRAWERRYGAVEPDRSQGERRYSGEDVARLSLLKQLTDAGHRISEVAALSHAELKALCGASSALPSSADALLSALDRYDLHALDAQLARLLATTPTVQAVEETLLPLLREVGARWETGQMSIAQERILSSALELRLQSLLAAMGNARSSEVLCTTLSGERHALGLLMFALLAVGEGARVRYLGPDLPPAEIARAAEALGVSAVAISMVVATAPQTAMLAELRAALPDKVQLWVGGSGAGKAQLPEGVQAPRSIEEHTALLRALVRA